MRVLPFDHRLDPMDGALSKAWPSGPWQFSTPTRTLTLRRLYAGVFRRNCRSDACPSLPARVRGLILLSAFGWYPAIFACLPRLGLALWRLRGDRGAQHILRVWRPLRLPAALGLFGDGARIFGGRLCTCRGIVSSARCRSASTPGHGWILSIAPRS